MPVSDGHASRLQALEYTLSPSSLRELLNLPHSTKSDFVSQAGSMQCALSRMVYVHTLKQIVGAAPGALSQLTLLQRVYLLFFFVQTRGQRTWRLVANHGVRWGQPKEESKGIPAHHLCKSPPKKFTNVHLPDDCKEPWRHICPHSAPTMCMTAGRRGLSPRPGCCPMLLLWAACHMYLTVRVLSLRLRGYNLKN